MTRIQLRHDTAENWITANPTLLDGEVGVETDTQKLKIGDGETDWNSLDYFFSESGGEGGTVEVDIATTDKVGIVKPDGTTITIAEDGTISSVGGGSAEVDTSNLVTLDGEQTITGKKTFSSNIELGSNSLSFSDGALTLNPQGSSNLNITTMGGALDITGNLTLTGKIKAYQNQANPLELMSDGANLSIMYGSNTLKMGEDTLKYFSTSGETDLLAGGGSSGGSVDTSNLVTTDTEQVITGKKIIQNRNSDNFGGSPDGLVFRCKSPKVDSWEAYIKATNSSGSSNDGVLFLGNTYGGIEIHRDDLHVSSILPQNNESVIHIGKANNLGAAIFRTGYGDAMASLDIRSGGDADLHPALNTSSIVAGDNISIEKDTTKGIVTISATGGGSSSGESEFTWGDNIAEETMNNECYLYHTPSGMLIQGGYITGRGGWDDQDSFTMNFEKPYTELLSLVLVCPDNNSVPYYMADYGETYTASFTVFPPPGPMMWYQWIAFGY